MDIKGILTDIVSAWYKEERIDLGKYESLPVVLWDAGRYGYILSKDTFIFDAKTLKRDLDFNESMYFDFKRIVDRTLEGSVDLLLTNDRKGVGKDTIRKFESLIAGDIWIPEKCLKRFTLKNASFKAKDNFSPIYVYEDSILVGVIMPCRAN